MFVDWMQSNALGGARALGGVLLGAFSVQALASTVGSESSVGLSADYDSNPYLLASGPRSAESAALVASLPVSYNDNAVAMDLSVRSRLAESHGPLAVLSNYEYFDGDWKFSGERSALAANVGWHRDSTLYNQYENTALQGHSVIRQESSAQLDGSRQLDERATVRVSGSYNQVNFDQIAGQLVTNYHYEQLGAQIERTLSELWQGSASLGVGRYELPDHSFREDTRYAQLGVNRALNENWLFSSQLGYSRLADRSQFQVAYLALAPDGTLEILQRPVILHHQGGTTSYALSLQRNTERAQWSVAASRSVQPSGLGSLLTQDSVTLSRAGDLSERSRVTVTLGGSRNDDSLQHLQLGNRRYFQVASTWSWRASEQWVIDTELSANRQRVNGEQADGLTVRISLLRQLRRWRIK